MPKCNCEKDKCLSPAVLQINNHDCPTLFHKVVVPAAMGDDETNPPRNGQYRNVLLVYEANGHVYMFSSDGIPTLLSGSSQGVDDYNELTNKPSIEGHELVDDSSLEDIGVTGAIEDALEDYTPTSELAEVAFTGDYDDLTGTPTIPVVNDATLTITRNGTSAGTFTANSANDTTIDIVVPTATSDLTNDSDFVSDANYVHTDNNFTDALESKLEGIAAGAEVNVQSDWNVTDSSSDAFIKNKPTIPTVNDATLTIKRNNESVGTFTANSATNTDINITVPVTAADVHALPDSTKYGASIVMSINTTDYKVTTTLKDQDGNTLGTAQVIDLPLESVVVNGSYDSTNKKIVLTLQNGNTIDIPVGDLISGLQTEITPTNMLSADLVDDATATHKFTTAADISKLAGIAAGAEVNVQSNWNEADSSSDAYIQNKPSIPTQTSSLTNNGSDGTSVYVEADELATVATSGSYNDLTNKPTIPTVNNATLTIQENGSTVGTFTANSATNKTVNVTVPVNTSDLTNDSGFIDNTVSNLTNYYDQTAINSMFNALPAVPTKTSDLTNDSGFVSNTDYASANTAGVIKVGNNLSIDANGVLSATGTTSLDWANITNKPTNVSYWTNDAGYITSAALPTKTSDLTNDSGFITSASLPTKTSDLTNDSGFITNSTNSLTNYYRKSETYTQSEVNSLINALPPVPTKTSELINDGEDGTAEYLEDDETAYQTASIPYGQCDNTSTSTVFTATVPGITELRDGVCMWLKNGVVTSASGFTININGLGAKPVYSNMGAASRETTLWNINYTMLFVYDSDRVAGGCWVLYRGYNSNDNTIGYQVRANSSTLPMKSVTYRYRLLFTSGDDKHFVPATNSTSSNATDSRTVCQDKINPFGSIFYYGATAQVNANARPGASSLWQQYAISLGYSFNRTGAALTLTQWKPVYVKAAPQTDGSAIIDSTTPYVQDLPTTDDGKIYIFLGVAYSATNIELLYNHPVYYYKDGMVRPYTNVAVDSALSTSSENPVQNKVITNALNGKASGSIVKANGANLGTTTIGSTTANYMEVTKLTTATDLDTLQTTGIYIVGASGNTNAPTSNWGTIFVDWTGGTKYQMYIPDGDNTNVYKRKYASSTWGSWVLMDKVKYTAYNVSPASDTTAAWKTVLGGEGTYFTWYNTNGKFTNQPSQYGFLRTIIGGQDIRQDFWTQTGGTHYFRAGNGAGWYGTAGNAGAFRNINVNNGTLTIQKNGTNVQTFTANQSSNVTANITVPTNLSDLYNDMGFASYSAGDHIDITNDVISAVDYVHSENPVSTSAVTPIVTGSMISNGTITADKLATGATIRLTLSTTDIGEGAALAANTLYGVYQ